ncbi:MAG: SRPBCC family protein [Actinobacteria bacterium]|nr:SRPBCC family protein [Actinomycetota bacterium]
MDEVSTYVAAPPEKVYDLVVDIEQMGQWSPETYRVGWLDGGTGVRVGARFKGWNRTKLGPFPARWSTTCTVERADRPNVFSFKVRQSGARWTYRFEPDGDGCRVTETREKGPAPIGAKLFSLVAGRSRDETVVAGMRTTLERLKAAAERS